MNLEKLCEWVKTYGTLKDYFADDEDKQILFITDKKEVILSSERMNSLENKVEEHSQIEVIIEGFNKNCFYYVRSVN